MVCRKVLLALLAAGAGAVLLCGCGRDSGQTLLAFCGSASKPALEECARAFERETGVGVDLQFSGSGTMLSRMMMSEKGDLYIPGSPDYMVRAEREGAVIADTEQIIAYLVPSILVQSGNPRGIRRLEDLAGEDVEVGIGNPEAVCVGLYALEILERNGLLDGVGGNVVVHARSCSATASLIAMKKVDAILGWRVFSEWKPDAIETVPIEPDRIPRLAYVPAAVSAYSTRPELGRSFIDYLRSPEGQEIFSGWGYIASEEKAREFAPRAQIGGEYELPSDYQPPGVAGGG